MSQRRDRHPGRDAGNLQDGAITLTLSSANPCMGISLASSLAGIARACLVTQCVFGRPACACMHMWGSGVCAWDRDLVRVCVHLDLADMGSGVWGQPRMKLWGQGQAWACGDPARGEPACGQGSRHSMWDPVHTNAQESTHHTKRRQYRWPLGPKAKRERCAGQILRSRLPKLGYFCARQEREHAGCIRCVATGVVITDNIIFLSSPHFSGNTIQDSPAHAQ